MRTRDEQIADMVACMRRDNSGFAAQTMAYVAEEFLSEAEQRVRAEIGRDSERLDWLEETSVNAEDLNIHCLMNTDGRTLFGVCGTGNYEETLRQAIDAAREVG